MELEKQIISEAKFKLLVSGRWDMMGNRIFEIEFPKYLSENTQSIILDLSQIEFIASIGIRSIVSHAKELNQKNIKFALSNPTEMVNDIFKNVGIDDFIEFVD